MTTLSEYRVPAEQAAGEILAWLSQPRSGSPDPGELLRLLQLLEAAPLPEAQRGQFLDLIYSQAIRLAEALRARLRDQPLPLPRPLRQHTRLITELLGHLARDYAATESVRAAPAASAQRLWRAMQAIGWQIHIHQRIAAPGDAGAWQQVHAIYQLARTTGLHQQPGPRDTPGIETLYLHLLLAAIAQPTSFTPEEIDFIAAYIAALPSLPPLQPAPPADDQACFWIDPDKDLPAQALVRRKPAPETCVLYLDCRALAAHTAALCARLQEDESPAQLRLPPLAGQHSPLPTLRRLQMLWGQPARRRFPRRRQSYRATLIGGLDALRTLARGGPAAAEASEWMVINESPDGYALMHVHGSSEAIRVGDVVAVQAQREQGSPPWQPCLIRWIVSDNPEHLEIGLQVLGTEACAAEIAGLALRVPGLWLPERPPLRPQPALVVPAGSLTGHPERLLLLVEKDNLCVREVRPTRLDEQTASVEVFSVETDHSP